jgi:transposase-like protein
MAQYRRFTPEFKAQAVELAIEYGNVAKTARELGIGGTTLERWVSKHKQENPIDSEGRPGASPAEAVRIKALEQDNARLRQENEFLKKAAAFFAKSLAL